MKMKTRHKKDDAKMKRTLARVYCSILVSIIKGTTTLLLSLGDSEITIGIPVILSSITTPTGYPVVFKVHYISPSTNLNDVISMFHSDPLYHEHVPFSHSSFVKPKKVTFT